MNLKLLVIVRMVFLAACTPDHYTCRDCQSQPKIAEKQLQLCVREKTRANSPPCSSSVMLKVQMPYFSFAKDPIGTRQRVTFTVKDVNSYTVD